MSKEREMVEALRDSLEATPTVGEGSSSSAAGGAQGDLGGMMDFLQDLWLSASADPIFYFKVMGILLLTVIIIVFAFQFIAME